MSRLERLPLHGSVVALGLTAVALLVSLLLRSYLDPDFFVYYDECVRPGLAAAGRPRRSPPRWSGLRGGRYARDRTTRRFLLVIATLIAWATASAAAGRRVLASTVAVSATPWS
jgi:hypothetical protein